MAKIEERTTYTCEYCDEKFHDRDACEDHEFVCGVNHYLITGELKLFNEEKNSVLVIDECYNPDNVFYVWWENPLAYSAFYKWYSCVCLGLEECVLDGEGACYWNDEWCYLDNKAVSNELVNGVFADQLCKVSRLTGEVRDEVCKGEALTMPEVEKVREKWLLSCCLGDQDVILNLTEDQANLLIYLRVEGWLGEADINRYEMPKFVTI